MNLTGSKKTCSKRFAKRIVAFLLIAAMLLTNQGLLGFLLGNDDTLAAETTKITSMEYYNTTSDGPTQSKSGVTEASFGFVMPKFNGKTSQELSLEDVEGDLQLYVKQENGTGGEWKKIGDVSYFIFNSTWGWEHQQWSDTADGWICWFKLTETTEIRFQSKSDSSVTLDYTFNFTKLPTYKLTSISTTETSIAADSTGGSATHWGTYTYNGAPSITYEQVKDDMTILVDNNDGKGFVNLLSNASSGFLWDQNFGIYTDGTGGLWFKGITWSFTLRFQKKGDNSIYTDVKVTYTEPVRSDWKLTSYDGVTSYDVKNDSYTASLGIVLPKVGGTSAIKSDLDLFRYEVCVGATYNNGTWTGGEWILLNDVADSGWIYQGNGYNEFSSSQQWGYFADTVYGLWFQPVKKDTYLRIGYPKNGKAGGAINNNYVYYTILGDPDAKLPVVADMADITVDDNDDTDIYTPDGWSMIWNDEFAGSTLDTSKWSAETGYLLEPDDIGTAGWGNGELQHYTDSSENISVNNGSLNITMKKEPKTFTESDDSSKKATALYSSGKLVSKNNFSFKYGRVDIRAKFPTGTGIWPALWMLPNDNIYGAWACSGEIDIFEGRGRIPNTVFGTLHYGSVWPGNLNTSDAFDMVADGKKGTVFSDWHVYSVVWEEDSIKIYCDGKCYFKCTNEMWYSGSNRGNVNAPFDQRFYLIMNLAAGGSFDNYNVPESDFTQADMYVDYVRVYQRKVSSIADEKPDTLANVKTNGANDNLFGDYKVSANTSTTTPNVDTTTASSAETTTNASSLENTTAVIFPSKKVTAPGKAKIKKITAKKKSAKKVKISLKKINGAKGYQIAIYKTKKNAKKNKKSIVKKFVNKLKVTIKSKKLKNKKNLYVKARAYKLDGTTKVYGKWSKIKKVKIRNK